jgi:hypothetical protein
VHALQDQSFAIEPLLRFVKGDGDRIAAGHALLEGDAVSAMFDVVQGSAFQITPESLREMLEESTARSDVGEDTPRFLAASLSAPYVDGFALVQALRSRGGWTAVDDAWRNLPASTEQLLHPEKLAAREPPITIAAPAIGALGAGWRAVLDDVMGELGLRTALEDWATRAQAARAAAGWGGDRYLVARRDDPATPGKHRIAVAWHVRFDRDADASEMVALLRRRFGAACRERSALGPFTYRQSGDAVVIVAGPWERSAGAPTVARGTCAEAVRWAESILPRR